MSTNKQLLFKDNLTFNTSGINLTVRRGVKKFSIGDKVDIVDADNRFNKVDNEGKLYYDITKPIALYLAEITGVKILNFYDLTNTDLIFEHVESCHNVNGLFDVMSKLYPDFDGREIVTLIYFKILV